MPWRAVFKAAKDRRSSCRHEPDPDHMLLEDMALISQQLPQSMMLQMQYNASARHTCHALSYVYQGETRLQMTLQTATAWDDAKNVFA